MKKTTLAKEESVVSNVEYNNTTENSLTIDGKRLTIDPAVSGGMYLEIEDLNSPIGMESIHIPTEHIHYVYKLLRNFEEEEKIRNGL